MPSRLVRRRTSFTVELSTRNWQSTLVGTSLMTPSVVGCGMEQATLTPPSTLVLTRASCCCLDRQPMRNLPDGSGRCDRMGPMVRWNRLAVLGLLSKKLATPVPRSSSTTGCCRNVGGGWLPCRRKGRPAGVGFAFSVVFSLAISVSVADFSVSFGFSIGVLGTSLALARRAFLFWSPPALYKVTAFGGFTFDVYFFIFSTVSDSFWSFRHIHGCICPVTYGDVIVHWENARVVT